MKRHIAGIVAVIMLLFMVAGSATAVIERIEPMYVDAQWLVDSLWGPEDATQQPQDYMASFATDLVADAVAQMPQTNGRWIQGTRTRQVAGGSGSSSSTLGSMLPDGIEGRPLVVPTQNAFLVQGTQIAIDRLREIIRMLDRPSDMVNIDVRSVDAPEEEVSGWGVDWGYERGDTSAGSVGNRPGGGLQLRYGRANFRSGLNIVSRSSRGEHVMGANVLTHNNTPATVAFGEVMPFITTEADYDQFGYRRATAQVVNTVFLGIDLWVLPRINRDDTVTVRVRPSISEWAGEVSAPGPGSPVPIVRSQLAETSVTVADGQSIVIGGMNRSMDTINEEFRGLFGQIRRRMSSHPTLILTPTIVRHRQLQDGVTFP